MSAVLLSGCSWLGMGGSGSQHGACNPSACAGGDYGYNGYGQAYGQPGAAAYDQSAYGAATGYVGGGQGGVQGGEYAGYGQGVGGAVGYGAGGLNGYGATANGAGVGYQGAYGVPGQVGQVGGQIGGQGAFGNGTVTTLGGAAPYGAAVGGQQVGGVYGQNVVGSQYASNQFVSGQAVRTVQGAPIYVPQPYGVPVGVGVGGGVAAAALPFGLSLLGGTDFEVSGNLYSKSEDGPAKNGDGTEDPNNIISNSTDIGYDDAFGQSARVGLGLERDLSRNTTLLGQVAYSQANGQTVEGYEEAAIGGAAPRGLNAVFSDLNTYSAEAGVRQYLGASALRPYVGATGGVIYNEGVNWTRTYQDDNTVYAGNSEYAESGFRPTAAGLVGAEMAVGHRAAIGVESGVRWTDGLDTNFGKGDAQISVPVTLRGRVAF